MKWAKIILRNCQSIPYAEYNLCSSLNIIEAPSETGKSIYIKMLRILCNWDTIPKEERLSVIRLQTKYISEDFSSMQIIKDDGTSLIFFVYKEGLLEWRMIGSDKKVIKSGWGQAPDYVRDFVGIHKVDSFNRVISIIDNEDKIAYDSTDPIQNSELVKMYTTHPELENRLHNTDEAMQELQTKKMRVRKQINFLTEDLQQNYRNLYSYDIENTLTFLRERNNKLNFTYNLVSYAQPVMGKKQPQIVDLTEFEDSIAKLKFNADLISNLFNVAGYFNKVPNIIDINNPEKKFNIIDTRRSFLTNLFNLIFNLEEYQNLKVIQDFPTINTFKADLILQLYHLLQNLIDLDKTVEIELPKLPNKYKVDLIFNLLELQVNLNKFNMIKQADDIDLILQQERLIMKKKLLTYLNILRFKLKDKSDLILTQAELDYKYSEFLKEHPLCPVCGQPLKDDIGGVCC